MELMKRKNKTTEYCVHLLRLNPPLRPLQYVSLRRFSAFDVCRPYSYHFYQLRIFCSIFDKSTKFITKS